MELKLFKWLSKPLHTAAEEITTKFNTPFFSTFIIVWIIRNHIFIYDLFFNNYILDKTFILQEAFDFGGDFFSRTFWTVGWTLGVLVIYYVVLTISRGITMLSEERIRLHLLSLMKSDSLATQKEVTYWKEKAGDVSEKNKNLELDYESLKFKSIDAKNDSEKFEKISEEVIDKIKKIVKIRLFENTALMSNAAAMKYIKNFKIEIDREFAKFDKIDEPIKRKRLN